MRSQDGGTSPVAQVPRENCGATCADVTPVVVQGGEAPSESPRTHPDMSLSLCQLQLFKHLQHCISLAQMALNRAKATSSPVRVLQARFQALATRHGATELLSSFFFFFN